MLQSRKKVIEIVSEECPSIQVLETIFKCLLDKKAISDFSFEKLKLNNVTRSNKEGTKYDGMIEVSGFDSNEFEKVLVLLGRGQGSFVDYMIFVHDSISEVGFSQYKKPIALFEVTKTTDAESRNSASFQRMSKKSVVSSYALYKDVDFFMLYVSTGKQKSKVSLSRRHANRLSESIGIQVLGAPTTNALKFANSHDFISDRKSIPPPVSGQQIIVDHDNDRLTLSIRLVKSDPMSISHDPNIGYCLAVIHLYRVVFKYTGKIRIINHGYCRDLYSSDNKLGRMLRLHDVELCGVKLIEPKEDKGAYFDYDNTSEKNATIYLAVEVMNHPDCETIYENHAGSERGYLKSPDGSSIVVPKNYTIPDFVFMNHRTKDIFVIEGKIAQKNKIKNGILQLDNLHNFNSLLATLYPDYKINKGLALVGSTVDKVQEWANGKEPLFHLTNSGDVHMRCLF